MPRPRNWRIINSNPNCKYFKPQWIPIKDLEEVDLQMDHYECIKLSDLNWLSMKEGAVQMWISASTFCRILKEAHQIIANAIINWKCIKICQKTK